MSPLEECGRAEGMHDGFPIEEEPQLRKKKKRTPWWHMMMKGRQPWRRTFGYMMRKERR